MSPKPKQSSDNPTLELMKHQKVGVFVDAQNMYHSAKNLYKSRVNFAEILKQAVGGRQLIRAFAYAIKTESGEEKAFLEALQKAGFELKVKDLQIFPGGLKKGDWDVGLAIDAISLSEQLDAVIIVSGDGDFEPLMEYLKFKGLIVETMGFRRSTSAKAVEAAHNFIDLEEYADNILLRKGKR